MGTRTTYTTTITTPIYASWKCEKCGEINFSEGYIQCRKEASTRSTSSSKLRDAQLQAAHDADEVWRSEAFEIIEEPNNSGHKIYSNLFMHNTNCTKCGEKPSWHKHIVLLWLAPFVIIATFFAIIAVFDSPTSLASWGSLIGCVGFLAWEYFREDLYVKALKSIPQEYTPVFGTLNRELIEYANSQNKTIPTPDETIERVKNYGVIKKESNADKVNCGTMSEEKTGGGEVNQYGFCRKCGTPLIADSGFCHKCGTEIMR